MTSVSLFSFFILFLIIFLLFLFSSFFFFLFFPLLYLLSLFFFHFFSSFLITKKDMLIPHSFYGTANANPWGYSKPVPLNNKQIIKEKTLMLDSLREIGAALELLYAPPAYHPDSGLVFFFFSSFFIFLFFLLLVFCSPCFSSFLYTLIYWFLFVFGLFSSFFIFIVLLGKALLDGIYDSLCVDISEMPLDDLQSQLIKVCY